MDEEGSLTEDEFVGLTFHLLIAGHETTVGLLTNGMKLLLMHPRIREELESAPDLWPLAVNEMVRFESPLGISMAIAMEDVEYSGITIPRGEVVAGLLASANRSGYSSVYRRYTRTHRGSNCTPRAAEAVPEY